MAAPSHVKIFHSGTPSPLSKMPIPLARRRVSGGTDEVEPPSNTLDTAVDDRLCN